MITSTYVPPRVAPEALQVEVGAEEARCYEEAEACREAETYREDASEACQEDASASTDSFDSGLDTRSDTAPAPSLARGRAEQLLATRAEDAVQIYRRYVAPECRRPVHLPTDIKRRIVESICSEDGAVPADCFDEAQEAVVASLEAEYFPDFLTSQFHAKHQVDVLTSGRVSLTDILYNDTALSILTEFLEGRGQRLVIEFWLAATNFSQAQGPAADRQADAMVLYDRFLSMQAPCPLGLPTSVRLQVEDGICSAAGPQPSCFQPALQLVAAYLEAAHLQPFLQSALYSNYVKELIATIQASPSTVSAGLSPSSCRTESDTRSSCSSERSSERPRPSNTLLAASSATVRHSATFDCGDLQDPDSLWRRRPVRDKVGRVNSFGRFQPGLDLAPQMSRAEVGAYCCSILLVMVQQCWYWCWCNSAGAGA